MLARQQNRWMVVVRLENTVAVQWRYFRREDAEDCIRKSKRLIPNGKLELMFDEGNQ